MEQIQKNICLNVFKEVVYLLRIFYSPSLFYDPTKPTKSIDKEILKFLFYDGMLYKYIPHATNGEIVYNLSNIISHIIFCISGRFWPQSTYTFVDQTDFIKLMKSSGFKVKSIKTSQRELFNNVLNNYLGYDLVTKDNENYIIDTRYLDKFELRQGYSKLGMVIHLDKDLKFESVNIAGKTRHDEFAIRRCLTAIFTIITIEHHFVNTHTVSDKLNVLLHQIDNKSAIFRVLKPFTHDAYRPGERGAIVLMGQTGLFSSFNFTRQGFEQYYEHATKNFNFSEFLTPRIFPGESNVNKHKIEWFNCIKDFVANFLYENKDDLTTEEGDKFLELIEETYPNITYPAGKSGTNLDKIIHICTMIIYINIKHECFSNSKLNCLVMNPFAISLTWKNGNKNTPLNKRISNLSEQTLLIGVSTSTSLDGLMLIDKRWIEMCCVTPQEKEIYREFFQSVEKLGIPKGSVLHPSNIGCSVSI